MLLVDGLRSIISQSTGQEAGDLTKPVSEGDMAAPNDKIPSVNTMESNSTTIETKEEEAPKVASNSPICKDNCIVHIDADYNPKSITVPVGTPVTWTNDDSTMHTVTSVAMWDENIHDFNSYAIPVQGKFSYSFDKAGVFEYYCTFHAKMVGKVIVTNTK